MSVYDYTIEKIDGTKVSLEKYKGKVLLIVNTATKCGFTPQYEGLEDIYEEYSDQGFEIIDLPCNQFLNQAPGSSEEVANFCQVNFGTKFETFSKIQVNGEDAHPLYKYLKEEKPKDTDNGGMKGLLAKLKNKFSVEKTEIQWNFTKFLIDREGNVIERYAPTVAPKEFKDKIEELL
ncbi:MAG: glutathione peroxidase [Eubacteriales bacterium]